MILTFSGWRKFFAFRDRSVDERSLRRIGRLGVQRFKKATLGPHSGVIYRRRGRSHRASAAGEYPARDTGDHAATIDYTLTNSQVQIGSGMFYARFLADGTRTMQPRRMSKHALTEQTAGGNIMVGRFVRWRRG